MKTIVSFLLLFVASLTLRAELIVGSSLEWLADTSANVGTYRVTETRKESYSAFQLSLQLDDSLKGKPPTKAESSYWVCFPKGAQPPHVARGDSFLIFFKPDGKESLRVEHLINLSTAQSGGWDSVAINSKFEVLTDQAKILALVKERIKAHPTAITTKWQEFPQSRLDVEVPSQTPAYKVLFSGSTCYLLLPEDLKPAKPNK